MLNVNGVDSTEDNANGVVTRANPNLSNNLEVVLTNRITGSVTTTDATPTTVFTFAMTAGSTVTFVGMIAAIESALASSVGGQIVGTVNRAGGGANVIGTPDKIVNASAAISTATFDITASGNNAVFTVTGVAATTIQWNYLVTYIQKTFI